MEELNPANRKLIGASCAAADAGEKVREHKRFVYLCPRERERVGRSATARVCVQERACGRV